MVAAHGDRTNVVIPDPARVLAEVVGFDEPGNQVEGALDVLGRERLAIVPLDALGELEGHTRLGCVPGPAESEIRHDGVEGGLRAWSGRR